MSSPHLQVRDLFLQAHGNNTCYGLGDWRRYTAGAWEYKSDLSIKCEVQDLAAAHRKKFSVTNGLITSVTELLKQKLAVPDMLFDNNENLLVFNDCALDIQTRTEVPHSPLHYATTKLPFNYDPKVRSFAWNRVIADAPYPETLREIAGLCLTPITRFEVSLWNYGPPGGGKSAFIMGLQAMLGSKSCILGLSELDRSSFALSQLPGKTMAISTEQPSNFIKSPHILNAIISGETINVDRKFRDQISITPKAKLVWAMNELPRVDTAGIGLFRRIILMHWPSLDESKRDPQLKDQIMQSGMAVVNWALPGLDRLLARGKFEIPPELVAQREEYRTHNDITQLFINEVCSAQPGTKTQSQSLYDEYKIWCEDNKNKARSQVRFAEDLIRLGFEKKPINGRNYWLNLKIQLKSVDSAGYELG